MERLTFYDVARRLDLRQHGSPLARAVIPLALTVRLINSHHGAGNRPHETGGSVTEGSGR